MKILFLLILLFVGTTTSMVSNTNPDDENVIVMENKFIQAASINSDVVDKLFSFDNRVELFFSEIMSGCNYGVCSCELITCTDEGGTSGDCWEAFEDCMCSEHEDCEDVEP